MAAGRRGDQLDPNLSAWEEVQNMDDWEGLLLGNGASRAVWSSFAYTSLFERACSEDIPHPLGAEDREFFRQLGNTTNFEAVLAALSTAQLVNSVLQVESPQIPERYASIQNALVEAVHAVHVPWARLTKDVLQVIRSELLEYKTVFTTNYDLLPYWAIMSEGGASFKDYLWDGVFDLSDAKIWGNVTTVLYLHGALHLYRNADGVTMKDRADEFENLLDRFGTIRDAVPLLVSEGTHHDKMRSITRSDYLTFALTRFQEHDAPLVVFGHSLGETDSHLTQAINGWGRQRIAYSVLPGRDDEVIRIKGRVVSSMPRADIVFFDASTHPFGNAELRMDQ